MAGVVILGVFVADTAYRADRMPRMGETILGNSFALGPGGKGSNQAVAAARAGGSVTFVSCVGKDSFGKSMVENFKNDKINTDHVFIQEDLPTGTALIMIDKNGEKVRRGLPATIV